MKFYQEGKLSVEEFLNKWNECMEMSDESDDYDDEFEIRAEMMRASGCKFSRI